MLSKLLLLESLKLKNVTKILNHSSALLNDQFLKVEIPLNPQGNKLCPAYDFEYYRAVKQNFVPVVTTHSASSGCFIPFNKSFPSWTVWKFSIRNKS